MMLLLLIPDALIIMLNLLQPPLNLSQQNSSYFAPPLPVLSPTWYVYHQSNFYKFPTHHHPPLPIQPPSIPSYLLSSPILSPNYHPTHSSSEFSLFSPLSFHFFAHGGGGGLMAVVEGFAKRCGRNKWLASWLVWEAERKL